jgi:hypothetical protein
MFKEELSKSPKETTKIGSLWMENMTIDLERA